MTALVTLSSRLTFCYKVVFSITWISGFGLGTVSMWMNAGPPDAVNGLFLIIWCLGSIAIWRICVPLKRLRIDGRNLCVSNYLKEIAIPVNLIDRVTENRWINIHPVTIHFRGDTEFGSEIVFMPKARFAFSWTPHPVVGEIERLAQTFSVGGMT